MLSRDARTGFAALLNAVAALACSGVVKPDGPGTPVDAGIGVEPPVAYVARSGTLSFTARTAAGPTTAVNWTATGGTVSTVGLYTAPANTGYFTVRATSQADGSKYGEAAITVMDPSSTDPSGIMPAGRWTFWTPGIPGGIPSGGWTVRTLPNYQNYNGGGTDASAAIQGEINAAKAVATATSPQVVFLPAGRYRINSSLSLDRANYVVLRGAGPGSTRGTGGTALLNYSGGPAVVFNPAGHGWRPVKDCSTAGVWQTIPAGAATIPVASATGWAVGDFLILDQADDQTRVFTNYDEQCRSPTKADYPLSPNYNVGGTGRWQSGYRAQMETHEVLAIQGNNLVVSDPLNADPKKRGTPVHLTFAADQHPQIWTADYAWTRWAGLEDVYVTGGSSVDMHNCAYCWIKHIESDHEPVSPSLGGASHVFLTRTFRCEIRDSYIHHADTIAQGGGAYGFELGLGAGDTLVENNIAIWLNKPILTKPGGGGNVIAYNYFDNAMTTLATNMQESTLDVGHHSYPYMVLVEGNYTSKVAMESYWGSGGYVTVYRNYCPSKQARTDSAGETTDIEAIRVEWYYKFVSVIGNVLGLSGWTDTYEVTTSPPGSFSGRDIYEIGNRYQASVASALATQSYNPNANDQGDGQIYESRSATGSTYSSLFRHGNWDAFHGNVSDWQSSYSRTLPNSLYLTVKPSFFGSNPWPWVDPTGATPADRVKTLPAKARYDAGTPNG